MGPLFQEPVVEEIRERFGLGALVTMGSTAELYRYKPGWLYRLTIDAGSHNLLVEGYRRSLRFPKVLTKFGAVGTPDDDPFYRYWLLIVEECLDLDAAEPVTMPTVALLDSMAGEVDGTLGEKGIDQAEDFIERHSGDLHAADLLDSMRFLVDFARTNKLDVDIDTTNFMVSERGVVITDAIYGADPEPFEG